jgi:hypothetical protein
MFPMRALLVTLIVLLTAADRARGEIVVAPTAEWLAHTADLVATATPLEVRNMKGPGDVWFTHVRYRLDRVLKGAASDGDAVTVAAFAYGKADPADLAGAVKDRRAVLLFAAVARDQFPEIDGKFAAIRQDGVGAAYSLDRPVERIFSPEFQPVLKAEELVERARAQVAREREFLRAHPRGTVERESRDVPSGTPAYARLYGGSAVYLWVPAYREGR